MTEKPDEGFYGFLGDDGVSTLQPTLQVVLQMWERAHKQRSLTAGKFLTEKRNDHYSRKTEDIVCELEYVYSYIKNGAFIR